jgi:hypothetical protein
MLLTTLVAVVVAVVLGVALAPAARARVAVAVGIIWVLIVLASCMWPDLARDFGLWRLAIILAFIGVSAGVLVKLFQLYDRFVAPPSDALYPRGPERK